jgi:hypothetical protein
MGRMTDNQANLMPMRSREVYCRKYLKKRAFHLVAALTVAQDG